LAKVEEPKQWIAEAFGHLKAIGATNEAVALVKQLTNFGGIQFSRDSSVVQSYGVVTAEQVGHGELDEIINMGEKAESFIEHFATAISQHKNWARELDGLNCMVAF
jgi:catalase